MLTYKLFHAGMPSLMVQAFKDITTGITAAGTGLSTATELTSGINVIATASVSNGVVLYSQISVGDEQLIFNGAENLIYVYPTSGMQINELGANRAHPLATNTAIRLTCVSTAQFVGMFSR